MMKGELFRIVEHVHQDGKAYRCIIQSFDVSTLVDVVPVVIDGECRPVQGPKALPDARVGVQVCGDGDFRE